MASNDRSTRAETPSGDPTLFFHPREVAIIGKYLGMADLLPKEIQRLEPDALELKEELWDEAANGIALHFADGGGTELALENAVARICLQNVQEQLPQWAACVGDRWVEGRSLKPAEKLPLRVLSPLHLFTINWADSGPGFSWPEAYYVTLLPWFNRYVVTASDDGVEPHGYSDFALGHFDRSENEIAGSRRVVTDFWKTYLEYDHPGWAYLFFEGAVNSAGADEWRRGVWPDEDDKAPDQGEAKTAQEDITPPRVPTR